MVTLPGPELIGKPYPRACVFPSQLDSGQSETGQVDPSTPRGSLHVGLVDYLITASWRPLDPIFRAIVATAGLVVIVLAVRWESWGRIWEGEQKHQIGVRRSMEWSGSRSKS